MTTATRSKRSTTDKAYQGFSAAEKAAARERVKELKREAEKADGLEELEAKIAEMPERDRVMATRIHEIVMAAAPSLAPKTWYGMPAYAKDGSLICFFKAASKFNYRYATLGFNDKAKLDDGAMWPSEFAVTELTDEAEARIAALVKKAVS